MAALSWVAVPRGAADLAVFTPRYLLKKHEAGEPFRQEDFRRAAPLLAKAVRLDPGEPNHLELSVYWHERAARLNPVGTESRNAGLKDALALARRAAWLRPGHAYAWTDIAVLKLHLGERDAELERAIVNASMLGPWEPRIQRSIAIVAFLSHRTLSAPARQAAHRLIGNGLKRHQAELVSLARAAGALNFFCATPGIGSAKPVLACI